MRKYAESRIPIEKWIIGTIFIGLVELCLRTADYVLWNETGYQNLAVAVAGILFGIVKHAVSRCLVLMVSLGWGVVTDSLNRITLTLIIILGIAYAVVGAIVDISLIYAIEDMKTISFDAEMEVLDFAIFMNGVLALISLVFTIWIVIALIMTMVRLRSTSQTRKLGRYLRLTAILSVSIILSALVTYAAAVRGEDLQSERIVDTVTEAVYLFLLIGVACLWRPNESSREYAYAMELSAEGADDLELTVVPSAVGRDERPMTGYYSNEIDERFKIDEAEPS
jgi:hypothetical protein